VKPLLRIHPAAQDFNRAHGGGVAAFDGELFEDVLQMFLQGAFGGVEDDGDVRVALALPTGDETVLAVFLPQLAQVISFRALLADEVQCFLLS
jgi:hypothetical protein